MFNEIFSFKGEFNRKEYFIYGILLPIILFALVAISTRAMQIDKEVADTLGVITLFLVAYIGFIAVVKRARATATNTWVVVLLWFVLTPIAMLYLLFAPSVQDMEQKRGTSLVIFIAIGFLVVIIGILAAVTIPKLAKTKQEASIQNSSVETTQITENVKKGLEAYTKGDYQTALQLWTNEAQKGNLQAQYNLGVMYYNGQGVKQDYKEALKWYTLAAKQGYPDAQYNLGVMYMSGQGVKQDYKEALKWFDLAAKQGYPQAQYNLGIMYVSGQGVKQDYKEALKWSSLAAKQGLPQAQLNLGVMYYNSQGVKQDYKEAVKWFSLAAKQGDPDAQFNLGLMYYNGQGVEQDKIKAYHWWLKAAKQGYQNAQYNLDILCKESPWVCQK